MKEDILKKIYGNIKYDTYIKLDDIAGNIYLPYLLARNIFSVNSKPTITELLVFSSIFAIRKINRDLSASGYTKDVFKIKTLYNDVIKNFVDVNNELEFNNSLDIYASFMYSLNNGYFSRNKHFDRTALNVRDIVPILPANILSGEGTCRHIAPMLDDVFKETCKSDNVSNIYCDSNDKGEMISELIAGHTKYMPISIYGMGNEEGIRRENLGEYVNELNDIRNSRETLNLYKELLERKQYDYTLRYDLGTNKVKSNHIINFVNNNGKILFLDPMNNSVFRKDPKVNQFLTTEFDYVMKICPGKDTLFKTKKSLEKLKELTQQSDESYNRDIEQIKSTAQLCENNKDLFEDFYDSNSETYQEIGYKLLEIKR